MSLLAVGMNGEPLPIEHGYPARLVVPGLYGYVSATKWVVDLELTRFDRAEAYWTRLGWSARGPIKTESRIDVPRSGQDVPQGPVTFGGVAWAQNRGVRAVEVRIDDGDWQQADLGASYSNDTWRLWSFRWQATQPGLAHHRGAGHRQHRRGPDVRAGRPGPRRRHRLAHGLVRREVIPPRTLAPRLASHRGNDPLAQRRPCEYTGQARIVESADDVGDSFGEVSPSVDVSWDHHFGAKHLGGCRRTFARQCQRAAALPRCDTGSPDEQDCDINGTHALGDVSDHGQRRVVAAEVDRRNTLPAQDEADDFTRHISGRVALAVRRPVHGRHRLDRHRRLGVGRR